MTGRDFLKRLGHDKGDLLGDLLALLKARRIPFCVIGGLGVNAYADPVVSLDLDLVAAAERLEEVESALKGSFTVKRFPHSLNASRAGSDLRIQFQTDPRYFDFVGRARTRTVLGYRMPVAAVGDVLQGKIWAAMDPRRRPSKRQKDLADILRLVETRPSLRSRIPAGLKARLGL